MYNLARYLQAVGHKSKAAELYEVSLRERPGLLLADVCLQNIREQGENHDWTGRRQR
jgi:hypothetical protein